MSAPKSHAQKCMEEQRFKYANMGRLGPLTQVSVYFVHELYEAIAKDTAERERACGVLYASCDKDGLLRRLECPERIELYPSKDDPHLEPCGPEFKKSLRPCYIVPVPEGE